MVGSLGHIFAAELYSKYIVMRDGEPAIRTAHRKEHIVKEVDNGSGYKQVSLIVGGKEKRFYVHRLVAETFISNPGNKPEVNHIDGGKTNNSVSNLEWVSHAENVHHSIHKLGNKPVGGKGKPVFCVEAGETFDSVKSAAESAGKSIQAISHCLHGRLETVSGKHYIFAI